jgi:hypothetical protein
VKASQAREVSDPPSPAPAAALELLSLWLRLCDQFRERERREIIEQEPSSKQLAEYQESLKWMIRGTRAILNVVSDPEFPRRHFAAEVSGKLLQLEESWRSLTNAVTEPEAESFIQKFFPNEPSTGSSA